jgi:DNA (cytosine-5)-methyltransferase 1
VSFTFVDLFAGIGGFHAALRALGGEGVLAAEIDDRAAAVYAKNWLTTPERNVVDLARDPARLVPEHAVLAGGFPCQPFSKSGRQLGMGEERGRLFHEVVKIIDEHKPPLVVLENVRNISGPQQKETWKAVVEGLRGVGYRVPTDPCVFSPHLLPPELGGAPQLRERVYILGTYVGVERAQDETDVAPVLANQPVDGWDPNRWDLAEHLLLDETRKSLPGRYRLTVEERQWFDTWNRLLVRLPQKDSTGADWRMPGFPLWSSYWHDRARVDADAPLWKQKLERKNIDFYNEHRHLVRAWLVENPQLRSFPASRQKLEWQAQDSARDLYQCLLHLRPSGIRAKRATYTPALVAMSQTPVIGPRGRRLVPREAARLQGFPDWFDFGDQPDGLTYKQLGNAINVRAMIHVIRQHVRQDAADLSLDEDGSGRGPALVAAVLAAELMPAVTDPRELEAAV